MNNFMQDLIMRQITRNKFTTTEQYARAYMDTVERGKVDAVLLDDYVANADEIIAESNRIASETHMAGNPIMSRSFYAEKDEQLARKGTKYNRTVVKDETKEIIEENEEEIEALLN